MNELGQFSCVGSLSDEQDPCTQKRNQRPTREILMVMLNFLLWLYETTRKEIYEEKMRKYAHRFCLEGKTSVGE